MVSPNLLSITSVPMQLNYDYHDGGLIPHKMPSPQLFEQHTNNTYIDINFDHPKLNFDTYQVRSSLGYGHYTDMDFMKRRAQEGKEACAQGTRERVQYGEMLRQQVKPSEIAHRKALERERTCTQIETVFLPEGSPDITFDPGEYSATHDPTTVELEPTSVLYQRHEYDRPYINFDIVQKAYVDIQYLGSPMYVPPDAVPLYAAEA